MLRWLALILAVSTVVCLAAGRAMRGLSNDLDRLELLDLMEDQ